MNTFFFAFVFICACITCHSSPVLNTIQIDEPQDDVIDLSRLGTMLFSEVCINYFSMSNVYTLKSPAF